MCCYFQYFQLNSFSLKLLGKINWKVAWLFSRVSCTKWPFEFWPVKKYGCYFKEIEHRGQNVVFAIFFNYRWTWKLLYRLRDIRVQWHWPFFEWLLLWRHFFSTRCDFSDILFIQETRYPELNWDLFHFQPYFYPCSNFKDISSYGNMVSWVECWQ